jgi:hypothetical protein
VKLLAKTSSKQSLKQPNISPKVAPNHLLKIMQKSLQNYPQPIFKTAK